MPDPVTDRAEKQLRADGLLITEGERLQLIGLATLAVQHNLALHAIVRAAKAITRDHEGGGHTEDLVWSDLYHGGDVVHAVDRTLERLNIRVWEDAEAGAE